MKWVGGKASLLIPVFSSICLVYQGDYLGRSTNHK